MIWSAGFRLRSWLKVLQQHAPQVQGWGQRVLHPKSQGPEVLRALRGTSAVTFEPQARTRALGPKPESLM